MANEDLTTYTEFDPKAHIAVTSSAAIVTTTGAEDAWLYRDYGKGMFAGRFLWYFTLRARTIGAGKYVCWQASNLVEDASRHKYAMSVAAYLTTVAGVPKIVIHNLFTAATGSATIALDTTYYVTVDRNGSAITVYLYSDAARTVLVTSATVAVRVVWTFRYVYVVNTWHEDVSGACDYTVSEVYVSPADATLASRPKLTVANDANGSTVTCTLSNAAGTTNVVQYMKIGTEYTTGRSLTGNGTLTQWGLTGSTMYRFILAANVQRLPSQMVRCFTRPGNMSISEAIAEFLLALMEELSWSYDIVLYERPARYGVLSSPEDRAVYLFEDDPTEADEEQVYSYKTWRQLFSFVAIRRTSDATTTAIGLYLNDIRARIEKIIRDDPTLGGLAQDVRIRAPETLPTVDDSFVGVVVNAEVLFRTKEDDPFSQ